MSCDQLTIVDPLPPVSTLTLLLQAISAKFGEEPYCDRVREDGSGHFVKMVHNGIEKGDMQLICEVYHIMKDTLGIDNDEMSKIFNEWNKGELDSFLIEISTAILKFKGEDGGHLLEKIRDSAGQKGTGKWTAISALEYGMPVTLIGESVFTRYSGNCTELWLRNWRNTELH